MKNIISAFALVILFASCEKETEIIPPEVEEIVLTMKVNGSLHCLNDSSIAAVEVTLSDAGGSSQTTTSNALGEFTFDNVIDGDYTLEFNNPNLYDYSEAQLTTIYEDLGDVVLAAREGTNIDHLAYNLINYDDGLTTFDMVFVDKLRSGDLLISEIDNPWRYVFTSELDTNSDITNQISFTHSEETDLDITAIFIGDNTGVTCP